MKNEQKPTLRLFVGWFGEDEDMRRRRDGWITGHVGDHDNFNAALDHTPKNTVVHIAGGGAARCVRFLTRKAIDLGLSVRIAVSDITTEEKRHDTPKDRARAVRRGLTKEQNTRLRFRWK